MTPAARLQAAIEILQELETTGSPADRYLRDWFRRRRYAGSKDRAAITERVFDVLRHRSSFAWRMQSEDPRALVIASLLHKEQTSETIRVLFSGEAYGPPPLSESETSAINSAPQGDSPPHAKGEYPLWLEPEFRRAFGERLVHEMPALQSRAPIDLRVNILKANRDDLLKQLRTERYGTSPMRYSPSGIRIPTGATGLEKTKLFASGAFELQDEASQIAALLVDARPGMRILDLAAGAGGKSLVMAAQMKNQGEIVARDIDAGRLRRLATRAERAGVRIISIEFPLPQDPPQPSPPLRGGGGNEWFDRVLVDAPCSGTGTWRRQPELRWRLTPERLDALKDLQASLLDEGARHTKPAGRLIYATCSLLPSEASDQIGAFLARHSDFGILPALEVWRESIGSEPPAGMEQFFRATPLTTGTDGFFAAILVRTARQS